MFWFITQKDENVAYFLLSERGRLVRVIKFTFKLVILVLVLDECSDF